MNGAKHRILALRSTGMTYAQIAAEVGCSVSWVGQIIGQHETRKILGLS